MRNDAFCVILFGFANRFLASPLEAAIGPDGMQSNFAASDFYRVGRHGWNQSKSSNYVRSKSVY